MISSNHSRNGKLREDSLPDVSVTDDNLTAALDTMILSASGWRKVFAPGGEHAADTVPAAADRLLAAGMGVAWADYLAAGKKKEGPDSSVSQASPFSPDSRRSPDTPGTRILVATDTRPTGPVLAEMLMRGLESRGCRVLYIGAASAPEAMALSSREAAIDGFAYVSASHNPLGHNGVKFGIGGGVIGGSGAKALIAGYRELIAAPGAAEQLTEIAGAPAGPNPRVADAAAKKRSLKTYREFLEEIAGGPGDEATRRDTLAELRTGLAERPVRIIADLNGSARCVSADRDYLEGLGARLDTFNDSAGEIAHAILPEGDSLEPCRRELEKAHAEDPAALIGYVPDNDGDRGNLVIWDEGIGGARRLEAQEVFALSTLAEFAGAAWGDQAGENGGETPARGSALVVNGPTSHRVRDIAAAYGAEVHEAEVGEANVVNRAAELRAAGYRVRLLGEGSNGGTITHPAEVRDPLNTITALLKLLRLPGSEDRPAPFEDWCRRIGRPGACSPGFGPADIVATLPVFTSTPTSAERALASITTRDHAALKTAWEEVFARQWSLHQETLARMYDFTDWYEINNEGTTSRRGVGPDQRTGAATGGLKVVFRDTDGRDAGFIWMRGSGTEPVFRVMAEVRGDRPEAEEKLALWQKGMVAAADRLARREAAEDERIPSPT